MCLWIGHGCGLGLCSGWLWKVAGQGYDGSRVVVMATHEITTDNLASTIETNPLVIMDFWAGWCGPCRAFAPVFEQASADHEDVFFGKVDVEAQQQIAYDFGIKNIPTLILFKEGMPVERIPGAMPAAQFESLIKALKGLDMSKVRAAHQAQS